MDRGKDQTTEIQQWVHDIRTHLHVMLAALGMLESGIELAEKREAYWQTLRRNLLAAIHLSDHILRAPQSNGEKSGQWLDVSALLEQVCQSFLPCAQRYGVELLSDIAAGLTALCDGETLQRVAFNLISNAVRYTPTDGIVHVLAAQSGEETVLCVSDTGKGIAPEVCQALCCGEGGEGLGLQIVSRLVRELGGTLQCKSELGVGTTFAVRLPAEM